MLRPCSNLPRIVVVAGFLSPNQVLFDHLLDHIHSAVQVLGNVAVKPAQLVQCHNALFQFSHHQFHHRSPVKSCYAQSYHAESARAEFACCAAHKIFPAANLLRSAWPLESSQSLASQACSWSRYDTGQRWAHSPCWGSRCSSWGLVYSQKRPQSNSPAASSGIKNLLRRAKIVWYNFGAKKPLRAVWLNPVEYNTRSRFFHQVQQQGLVVAQLFQRVNHRVQVPAAVVHAVHLSLCTDLADHIGFHDFPQVLDKIVLQQVVAFTIQDMLKLGHLKVPFSCCANSIQQNQTLNNSPYSLCGHSTQSTMS